MTKQPKGFCLEDERWRYLLSRRAAEYAIIYYMFPSYSAKDKRQAKTRLKQLNRYFTDRLGKAGGEKMIKIIEEKAGWMRGDK